LRTWAREYHQPPGFVVGAIDEEVVTGSLLKSVLLISASAIAGLSVWRSPSRDFTGHSPRKVGLVERGRPLDPGWCRRLRYDTGVAKRVPMVAAIASENAHPNTHTPIARAVLL